MRPTLAMFTRVTSWWGAVAHVDKASLNRIGSSQFLPERLLLHRQGRIFRWESLVVPLQQAYFQKSTYGLQGLRSMTDDVLFVRR